MCTDIAGISGQLNFQDIQDFFALGAEIQNKITVAVVDLASLQFHSLGSFSVFVHCTRTYNALMQYRFALSVHWRTFV